MNGGNRQLNPTPGNLNGYNSVIDAGNSGPAMTNRGALVPAVKRRTEI